MMMSKPLPGTVVLTQIHGWKGEGVWILQALMGDTSPWNHVGLMMYDDMVFEAHPSGARLISWEDFIRSDWGWQRPWVEVPVVMTDEQRLRLTVEALRLVGSGYNWTTYPYLAAYRLRLPWVTGRLKAKLSRSERMICSWVIEELHRRVGVTLFEDKEPYDVLPGHFAKLLI